MPSTALQSHGCQSPRRAHRRGCRPGRGPPERELHAWPWAELPRSAFSVRGASGGPRPRRFLLLGYAVGATGGYAEVVWAVASGRQRRRAFAAGDVFVVLVEPVLLAGLEVPVRVDPGGVLDLVLGVGDDEVLTRACRTARLDGGHLRCACALAGSVRRRRVVAERSLLFYTLMESTAGHYSSAPPARSTCPVPTMVGAHLPGCQA